jgi:uncharacterized protein (TIGR02284 family)
MVQTEKTAEIINDLVKINNDRIEGYKRAVKETKQEDTDLRDTFNSMISQSSQNKQELSGLVTKLGEQPEQGTRTDGKIYRAWMDVKATFSGNSRKSVLENCEFGEDAAQKAYKTALSSDGELMPEARTLLQRQELALKASHDLIKRMRDQTK